MTPSQCSTCKRRIEVETTSTFLCLDCGYVFCTDCARKSPEKTCPYCGNQLVSARRNLDQVRLT
jgi:hypothetical protein